MFHQCTNQGARRIMATITERKGRFLVPVRRDGFKAVAKTFGKKQDAAAWARRVEADMESGRWLAKVAATPTLAQAIEEYRQGAGNKLKGRETNADWLDELKTNRIASKRVNDLTPWPCAFNQPCRPRRAIGPTLRQAQTVHWTVCVRAQRWTGPAAAPGFAPCANSSCCRRHAGSGLPRPCGTNVLLDIAEHLTAPGKAAGGQPLGRL